MVDAFCGINAAEDMIAFQSTRIEGVGAGGTQIGTGDGTGVQDVFVRDLNLNQEDAGGGVNSAIGNLTDAATADSFAPDTVGEDGHDICYFGPGWNAVEEVGGEDYVLFVSNRTGAGDHRTDGDGSGTSTMSEVTNASAQGDVADIFSSTLAAQDVGGLLNTLANLSDGEVGDAIDTKMWGLW